MKVNIFIDDVWFWTPDIFYYKEKSESNVMRYGFRRFYSLTWFCFAVEVEV